MKQNQLTVLLTLSCLFTAGFCANRCCYSQDARYRIQLEPRQRAAANDPETRWYASPVKTVTGVVEQIDEHQISILVDGQTIAQRHSAARLISIEPLDLPDDQRQAIDAFGRQAYTDALTGLIRSVSEKEVSQRPPVWRQQWLSMLASQAAMRSGRGEISLELVNQLDSRPLPQVVVALLPIDWTGTAEGTLFDSAAKMASSPSLAVKLVAASWLLRSPKYRPAAETAIKRLSKQSDRPVIAMLATQLAWQTNSPAKLSEDFGVWRSSIDSLPMSLQTGPLILISSTARRLGLKDESKALNLSLIHAAPTWHPDLPTDDRR
ncbi:hypothetical protein U8335_16000 [Roseiconus lacunae]|uniref:hypothetical protein n=1 Tax=Roseiconus lacunae TaxID=2605694 RepID=UPI003092A53A|nr:hypothetical protein U8335_16000 [Stieleria sp. HD01]